MELRHLRYFIAVAEELHFGRAAQRLHIEQSPLSRAVRDLERDLNVELLKRTTRSTRLTWAGKMFLQEARRVLAALEQARLSSESAASGFRGSIRVALSDGIAPPRLTALLARCRVEEPEVRIRLFEVPLTQQLIGLHNDLYDVGFSHAVRTGDGIVATPAWAEPLVLAIPARHPLLAHKRVAPEALLRYPLIGFHPEQREGAHRQVKRLLRTVETEDDKPVIAEYAASFEAMLTLVAAGYGLGFANAEQLSMYRHPEVIARPLAGRSAVLTTCLLRPDTAPSEQLGRFIGRAIPAEDEEDADRR